MDVVSYRGPGAAGGVSSGLANAWRNHQDGNTQWWFIADQVLKVLACHEAEGQFRALLPENLVQGHYRYANEFLWPLMHDLPQRAIYRPEDRAEYRKLNVRLAEYIATEQRARSVYFIQDYQLALLPQLLNAQGARSMVFWHIPWPKKVPAQYVEPIAELARGLLCANLLAFHTEEYVTNFLNFVSDNLAEYRVDMPKATVHQISGQANFALMEMGSKRLQPYVLRPYTSSALAPPTVATQVVAKPLGIELGFWQSLAEHCDETSLQTALPNSVLRQKIVLSVDRADYTKAVLERLQSIDRLLCLRPELIGQVSFVQICTRTRGDLEEFERYWQRCQSLCKSINTRWQVGEWQPITWIEKPMAPPQLSTLYRRADAMLVNPVRDGLNLTAKEYAACQGDCPGALLLSPEAGAWHEIGAYCLPAHPLNRDQMIESILRGLTMSQAECRARNLLTKMSLENNTLTSWFKSFAHAARALSISGRVAPEEQQRKAKYA